MRYPLVGSEFECHTNCASVGACACDFLAVAEEMSEKWLQSVVWHNNVMETSRRELLAEVWRPMCSKAFDTLAFSARTNSIYCCSSTASVLLLLLQLYVLLRPEVQLLTCKYFIIVTWMAGRALGDRLRAREVAVQEGPSRPHPLVAQRKKHGVGCVWFHEGNRVLFT